MMLCSVRVEEINEQDVRLTTSNNPGGKVGPCLVRYRPWETPPGARLRLIEKSRRSGQRANQVHVLGMVRSGKLWQHDVRVHADADRPAHDRGAQATRLRGRDDRRHPDVAGVPVPSSLRFVLGIEDSI